MAKQKNAELGFANSKYGEIKKVYSIWICIGHAKQKNDVINSYTIQESCHTKIWHAPRNHFDIMTAVMEMCNFSDFIEERGIKKGLEQGKVNTTVQHVQNLMQFSNLSADEAMKMLGVEKELQSVILNKLHQA